MKKGLRILVAFVILMSMFTVTVSAKDLSFYLIKNQKSVTDNTKDRAVNTWLLTIDKPTAASSVNFVEGQTVIGFRIRSTEDGGTGTAMSDYVTVSSFVTNRAYPYTTVPYDRQKIYLHMQVDSTSKLPYVAFTGKWFT